MSGSRYCKKCGLPLAPGTTVCSVCAQSTDDAQNAVQVGTGAPAVSAATPADIPNPYREGILVSAGVSGVFLVLSLIGGSLVRVADWNMMLLIMPAGMMGFFLFLTVIIWILGSIKAVQIRNFLGSTRPIMRWTYSTEEWRAMREQEWQEVKEDWKLKLGCLTALFGVIGGMTGTIVGLSEDGLEGAIFSGIVGLVVGLVIGGSLGTMIGLISHMQARRDYHRETPGMVALGVYEIYANGDYFKGGRSGRHIQKVSLKTGTSPELKIKVYNPKPRGSSIDTWLITVPPRLVEDVQAILPRIQIGPGA